VLFGVDGNDTVDGGDDQDVILGDNGLILRTVLPGGGWLEYPEGAGVIRDIVRFDDIDRIEGNDVLSGGAADDILMGQRGNDVLRGNDGDDELTGHLGDDTISGGAGRDILLGDVGVIVRTFNANGSIRRNSDGSWHKDILLEDVGIVTGSLDIDRTPPAGVNGLIAQQLLSADLMIATGAFNADGSKHLQPGNGAWNTGLLFVDLVAPNNDSLDGGDDDDVIIGQRGDDTLLGGSGNDLMIADNASNTLPFETDTPNIVAGIRLLEIGDGVNVAFTLPDGGSVVAPMATIFPQEFGFSARTIR
jgi:Ca2+-binding RTX toxin-like protein